MNSTAEQSSFYFAHPINVYNTPLEDDIVSLITQRLPGTVVENPNQLHHRKGYEEWKKRSEDARTGAGMGYFFEVVLPACNGCVALPFLDGKVGAGVAGEIAFFIKREQPVYFVEPESGAVRPLTGKEKQLIVEWSGKRLTSSSGEEWEETGNEVVLSIVETRLRTWTVYYREKRTYESAHLVSLPIPPGFYPEKQAKA